jgi:flagellar L-ring protein precursor FlgH
MKMQTTTVIVLVGVVLCSAVAVSADSLYASAPAASGTAAPINYFTDPKAHAVGDILTIVITENATGSSTATTNSNKTQSANFGPGVGSILSLIRTFGLSGTETSNASGTTTRTDALTATIAVTVKAVLPNGNLSVEGSRTVGTNADTQTITLTGIVRPIDISQTNTVQSPQVADAQIKYSGKGPVGEIQHDGLVQKIFKIVF